MTKEPRIYHGESAVPFINGAGKTKHPHAKDQADHYCTPHTKINLNGLKA